MRVRKSPEGTISRCVWRLGTHRFKKGRKKKTFLSRTELIIIKSHAVCQGKEREREKREGECFLRVRDVRAFPFIRTATFIDIHVIFVLLTLIRLLVVWNFITELLARHASHNTYMISTGYIHIDGDVHTTLNVKNKKI